MEQQLDKQQETCYIHVTNFTENKGVNNGVALHIDMVTNEVH